MMDHILIYYYFLSFLSLKEQVRHHLQASNGDVSFLESFYPQRTFVKRILDAYSKYGECL